MTTHDFDTNILDRLQSMSGKELLAMLDELQIPTVPLTATIGESDIQAGDVTAKGNDIVYGRPHVLPAKKIQVQVSSNRMELIYSHPISSMEAIA